MATYYMHTIDGKPAEFDGEQLVFAVGGRNTTKIVRTLRQIRRNEEKARAFRIARGWGVFKYGYVRVETPEA